MLQAAEAQQSLSQSSLTLSTEQLCQYARQLAKQSETVPVDRRGRRALIRRFRKNAERIRQINQILRSSVRHAEFVPVESDWVLDNFFVIDEQLQEIAQDLPVGFLDELPRVAGGDPHVYRIAHEITNRSGAALDEDTISRFMHEYQTEKILSIGEMWAFPIMLRLTLVEQLRRLGDQMLISQDAHRYAAQVVTRYKESESLEIEPSKLLQSAPWIAELADASPEQTGGNLTRSLNKMLRDSGWKLADLVRLEHQRSASSQVTLSNTITSMRLMSMIDWATFVEDHCAAEQILRTDPADCYATMTADTRNRYRSVVERLAKGSAFKDHEVAAAVIELCNETPSAAGSANAVLNHVGYWLCDQGLGRLENRLRYQPSLRHRMIRSVRNKPFVTFFGMFGLLLALSITLTATVAGWHLSGWWLVAACFFAAIALSELAIQMTNWGLTLVLPPNVLPKLELERGVPEKHPTMIVIPCMFGSQKEVDIMMQRLENHFLSNSAPGLKFALLTDFSDAATEATSQDGAILERARYRLETLNRRYSQNGNEPFYLLHRGRTYNPHEGCWMGWERKRGKLMEFGKWIKGDDRVRYQLVVGDTSQLAEFHSADKEPLIITLDADTQLPHGTAMKLIGTLAHPLVRPVWNETNRAVDRGYVVLQPRVSIDLRSRMLSKFAALYSTGAGLNPYVTASSDVYQDLFCEGSFTGKGIYDLNTFEHALHDAFPENAILSHDLIEGAHTRVAMTSDIEVFDGYPSRYEGDAKRNHRWVRGDWQIAPWLLSRVPTASGWRANPIHALSKWKILDNMRRSLVTPSVVAFLATASIASSSFVSWALLIAAAIYYLPPLLHLIYNLPRRPQRIAYLDHVAASFKGFTNSLLVVTYEVVMIAHKAHLMVDAIVRTLFRMFISKRYRLQWQTAQAVEMANKGSLVNVALYMWASPAIALAIAVMSPWPSLSYVGPILLLWLFAPAIAYLVSKPKRDFRELDSDWNSNYLRRIARRTWSYFEAFATEEHSYLPPDNVQEFPDNRVATRISPTNEGLFLLSAMAARDFGFIGHDALIKLWRNNWYSWKSLETHDGHFYNWYDTTDLRPLPPRYISTVDSGNLAACLLTWQSCLSNLPQLPMLSNRLVRGILDTLDCLIEDLQRLAYGSNNSPSNHTSNRMRDILVEVDKCRTRLANRFASTDSKDDLRCVDLVGYGLNRLADLEQFIDELYAHVLPELDWMQTQIHIGWFNRKIGAFKLAVLGYEADFVFLRQVANLLPSHVKISSTSMQSILEACDQIAKSDDARAAVEAKSISTAIRRKLDDLATMAADAERTVYAMDFKPLYNKKTKLFSIGYNVDTERRDKSQYDMLASESRLGSYVAIAKGDVPAAHWFRLGRQSTHAAGAVSLVSWGGTMFEYLMPPLLQKHFEKSLLTETCLAAIRRQQQYARQRKIPWGISESAFCAINPNGDYQYQAFGVPGLGLKRGLAKDLVIAPYASLLAVELVPKDATENLRLLESLGALGAWGFYDAVDYTPSRVPANQKYILVRNYMAHHHGMSILAIANGLFCGIMQNRFSEHRITRACELMLQEKYPTTIPRTDEVMQNWEDVPPSPADETLVVRKMTHLNSLRPRTMSIGNGRMASFLTHSGLGFLRWNDVMITRWRDRVIGESYGQFLYLRDVSTKETWSAAFEPVRRSEVEASVAFAVDKAEYRSRFLEWDCVQEITVSPENDAEIRRVRLTNNSPVERQIELTCYCEVVLAPQNADLAHPAFQKLFIETGRYSDRAAIFANRRPRSPKEVSPWVAFVVAHDGARSVDIDHETSREKFIGRLNGIAAPAAINQQTLQGSFGAVLDPCFATRIKITLPASQTITLSLATVAAKSRTELDALVDLYSDSKAAQRAFELAWVFYPAELKGLRINSRQAHLYQRLAAYLMYPCVTLRQGHEFIASNVLSQSSLWQFGISGDRAIMTVSLTSVDEKSMILDLSRAHAYLNTMGFHFDLVFINEYAGSYIDELQEVVDIIQAKYSRADVHGGRIYSIARTQLNETTRNLLRAHSAVYLQAADGSLVSRIEKAMAFEKSRLSETMEAASAKIQHSTNSCDNRLNKGETFSPLLAAMRPVSSVNFDNGWGYFPPNKAGYEIDRSNHAPTPAPWSHIMANKQMGTVVTESGGGYTWFGNSREFKLSAWGNDPVMDAPSEHLWIRDEDSETLLCPLASADTVLYQPGVAYFESEHIGLSIETRIWVDTDDPVKIVELQLTNTADQVKHLSITHMFELVLGVQRESSGLGIVSTYQDSTNLIAFRNTLHESFANQVVFFANSGEAFSCTGDASSFRCLGIDNRTPAAVYSSQLDRRVGTALDPIAATGCRVTIQANQTAKVRFIVGTATSESAAHALAAQFLDESTSEISLGNTRQRWLVSSQPFFVTTPDVGFNRMVNDWLLYQTIACRILSRTAFYQAGGAFGFRDQLQDCMAAVYSAPGLVREHILRAASRQFVEGDVQHWWHIPSGKGTRTKFSDDLLFLPYVACHYVKVTGDETIWHEQVRFVRSPILHDDEPERYESPDETHETASLLEHCRRAVTHALRFGEHGLPLMGGGDWNDGMNLVGHHGKGESVWVGWFLLDVLEKFAPYIESSGDYQTAEAFMLASSELRTSIDRHAWNGDWYLRAFFDSGEPLGAKGAAACEIDSIAQSWAVIARGENQGRAIHAFEAAVDRLVDPEARLIHLFAPPFDNSSPNAGYINGYPPGIRENGGQYNHAAVWLALAAVELGRADLALRLFNYINPIHRAADPSAANTYRLEPYVVAADIYTNTQHIGRGGWSWYTGAAGWMYRLAIESILGIKVNGSFITFQPCMPLEWSDVDIKVNLPRFTFRVKLGRSSPETIAQDRLVFRCGERIDMSQLKETDCVFIVL